MTQDYRFYASCAVLTLVVASCRAISNPSSTASQSTRTVSEWPTPSSLKVQSPSSAAPASQYTDQPDLGDYVTHGLVHSPVIAEFYELWQATLQKPAQAASLPDPRLSYGEFLEQVQTRTGPQLRKLGISQAFPWPGELALRGTLARTQAEVAWQRVLAAKLQTIRNIEAAYYDYALLGRELQLKQELLELLRGLQPIVQARVRAGGEQVAMLRLEVEIARSEDGLAQLLRRQQSVSAHLVATCFLPRDNAAPLPLPTLTEPTSVELDTQAYFTLALEKNPSLQALQLGWRASQESVELSGYKAKPRLSVGIDTVLTGESTMPGTVGSGDDPVMLHFSMSLPIWRTSYQAAQDEARHTARAARKRLDQAETHIWEQVEHEAFKIDDASRKITLYRDSILPRAREVLQLTLVSYRTGESSILDLIDAERTLIEFDLSYWRACSAHQKAKAQLHSLIGGDFS